jgi:hypothetical protein
MTAPGRRRPDMPDFTTQQVVVIVALVMLTIVMCIVCGSKVHIG